MISLYAINLEWPGQWSPIPLEFMTFPGGEEFVKFPKGEQALHSRRLLVVDARLNSSTEFVRLLQLADALDRHAPDARRILFCPYLPGARQDRGAPLSAKVYADLLNGANFFDIITVDPHSDVMPALLKHCTIIPAEDVFPRETFPGPANAVLLCPDQGAGKRVEAVAARFGYRVIYAHKHRDPATGALTDFSVAPVPPGADAIIVDDICDGGGTFLGIAEVVKKHWSRVGTYGDVKLHLWTTHGIYSKGPQVLEQYFSTVACTDSFPTRQGTEDYETQVGFRLTRVPLMPILESVLKNRRYT
jgi:ribose-phosphate pyrophosphokinase